MAHKLKIIIYTQKYTLMDNMVSLVICDVVQDKVQGQYSIHISGRETENNSSFGKRYMSTFRTLLRIETLMRIRFKTLVTDCYY